MDTQQEASLVEIQEATGPAERQPHSECGTQAERAQALRGTAGAERRLALRRQAQTPTASPTTKTA